LSLYEKETFVFENDTLYYRIIKPLDFDDDGDMDFLLVTLEKITCVI
tara:strand:- start:375 stop:515 length:141 start_codon:yes stop_codon:yes gene_type:complete